MSRRITKHLLVGFSLALLAWGILGVFLTSTSLGGAQPVAPDLSPTLSSENIPHLFKDFSIWIGSATRTENVSMDAQLFSWNSGGTTLSWSNSLFTALDIGCFVIAIGTISVDRREDRKPQKLRDRVLDEVITNPGIHLRELHRIIGCAMGALQYHIRFLEQDGLVISLRNGNVKHLFTPSYSSDERVLLLTAMARNPTVGSILSECASNGQTTQAEISRILSVDKSLISYYINSLLDANILRSVKVFGREKPVLLTEWARTAIDCEDILVH